MGNPYQWSIPLHTPRITPRIDPTPHLERWGNKNGSSIVSPNPTLKGGVKNSGIIYPGVKKILVHRRNFDRYDELPGFGYNLLLCQVEMEKRIRRGNHLANQIFQT